MAHLTDMDITRVSLVDKGANAKQIAVLKRKEGSMSGSVAAGEAGSTGIVAWLRKQADALAGKAPVAKAQTFAAMVAGQELTEAMSESWWTLYDAIWAAIWATDENGADLTLEAKQALVGQDLDEFKAYLLGEMSEATGIGKRDQSPRAAVLAGLVAKEGRKISGSRLERLQSAAEALTSVIDEAITQDSSGDASDDEEDSDVEKADITKAITDGLAAALEPVTKRLDALEAAGKVEKTGDGDDAPVTLETIAEGIGKLADRIEKLETAGAVGKRTSIVGQDAGDGKVAKKSVFAGMF